MWQKLVAVIFLVQIGFDFPIAETRENAPLRKRGSHHGFVTKGSRCTPCEQSPRAFPDETPASNSLNSEYRGNGADNLGYDWSPKAWGGPAFPQKSRSAIADDRARERGGRQMSKDWSRGLLPENVRIVCDTCRAYWTGSGEGGQSIGASGRQFPVSGGPSGGQFPVSGGSSGRQFPVSGGPSGGQFPVSGGPSGGQFPVSGGSSGRQFPVSGGSFGGQFPASGGPSGGQFPTSGGSSGRQFPVSGGSYGGQFPASGGPSGGQFPTSGGPSGGQFPASGGPSGGQFPSFNGQFRGGRPDSSWYGGSGRRTGSQEYETRVSSGTVGVLIKPGSRIAYVPSRSGDMYWDGVSGGGTRWDGFSNGISWVVSGAPSWGQTEPSAREERPEGYAPGAQRSGKDYAYGPAKNYRPWDGQKGNSGWDNGGAKGYYYHPTGYPNQVDSQWRDRAYASNWHYGSTNQNGWNGGTTKWSYGSKHWDDNDRSANRFYFNSPQDSDHGSRGGSYPQYGNRYPNYEPWTGQRGGSQRPYVVSSYRIRLNDRDPPADYSTPPGNRPWEYDSGNRFGDRRPTLRPEWRPDPNYPSNYNKDVPEKYPAPVEYEHKKPWSGRPSYGPSTPDSGSGYPYGGNQFPGSTGGGRPSHETSGHHVIMFYPNDGHHHANGGSGGRPEYPSSGSATGGHPGTGYPSGGSGGYGGSYPSLGHPAVIYTGVKPSGGGSSGYSSSGGHHESPTRYPAGGSGYPSSGGHHESPTRYPAGGSGYPPSGGHHESPTRYPAGGSGYSLSGGHHESPTRYPAGGSGYPSSGGHHESPTRYPAGGSGYPSSGGHHESPTRYPAGGSGYSSGGSRPGGYSGTSGGGFAEGGNRPGGYPVGGSRPEPAYPSQDFRPGGFTGTGSRPYNAYPETGHSHPAVGISSGVYPYGSGRPGYSGTVSYPNDRPESYPSGGSGYAGGYYGGNRYPGGGGRPDGYSSGASSRPSYPGAGHSGYESGGNPPKGYYTGIITDITNEQGPSGGAYSGGNKDSYPYGGVHPNKHPVDDKNSFGHSNDGHSGGGGYGGSRDKVGDRFYFYGQDANKNGHRQAGSTGDQSQGSSQQDKNAWNYDEYKDGSLHRSGGSYPPYKGGQYYTSSYLATATTATGQQQVSESKTQAVTKPDEVTQATPAT